jgi:enamine deaminase RidA (YjgF/YER057c/UK114 family)
MASVERINPDGLAPPPGNRFSHVVRAGNHVWIAGQTARTADGVNVGIGDPRAQADQVFANLATAMASVGGTLGDIVKVTIFLTPGDDVLAAARAAQDECWDGKPLPAASSMVIVHALVQPDYVIEVEAEAILDP